MIFTRLRLVNLYSFADAELDLSFPRKLVNSALSGEHLLGRPKFYYRKICIVTGGNASGKTSLGRVLLGIQLFLRKKILYPENFPANDKSKDSSFEVDFATEDFYHHRLFIRLVYDDVGGVFVKEIKYGKTFIRHDYSCLKTTKILNDMFVKKDFSGYLYLAKDTDAGGVPEEFKKHIFYGGWYYLLSEIKENTDKIVVLNRNIFELIMKTFDSSIESVSELKIADDSSEEKSRLGYYILFKNGDSEMVTKFGDVTNSNRLSRGTFDAVILSHFISSVYEDLKNENGSKASMTYFLDERMAFVHSELERTLITLIISKLKVNSQFFYTTHNSDIFKLDLPIHSYVFIKKQDDKSFFIDASIHLKKNDRNLYHYVENDVFGMLPDLSFIEEII
ncbi:ATP-binding protein [Salmonella enterica subsp. diarizonae]|nr:ATP-binding protein [Salmonella enterica subsp. diarizonae]